MAIEAINSILNMDISSLTRLYEENALSVKDVIRTIYQKAESYSDYNIWIHLIPEDEIMNKIDSLESLRSKSSKPLPLFGIPFAVKDNIDVKGLPTTAACPDFSYIAQESAQVVQYLEEAGAIMIGKTNLDQFATGLVGTRSPYGAVKNAYNKAYISGGSSSGSAVAVALGLVSFSLGTDTAGSGRVPAGFNNIIGLKPSKGLINTHGVVPACKSLDCVSIFTLSCEDAELVLQICTDDKFDQLISHFEEKGVAEEFTFGVPSRRYLNLNENRENEQLFENAIKKLISKGGKKVEIDFAPFQETGNLLYEGPWVAERLASIKDFFEKSPDSLFPETRTIIEGGKNFSAVDTFQSLYKLEELKLKVANIMNDLDFLLVPTAPTIYRIEEIEKDPLGLNKNLGYYTNFVNLQDLSAIAIPNGFKSGGLPTGITLIASAYKDKMLLQYARKFLGIEKLQDWKIEKLED